MVILDLERADRLLACAIIGYYYLGQGTDFTARIIDKEAYVATIQNKTIESMLRVGTIGISLRRGLHPAAVYPDDSFIVSDLEDLALLVSVLWEYRYGCAMSDDGASIVIASFKPLAYVRLLQYHQDIVSGATL